MYVFLFRFRSLLNVYTVCTGCIDPVFLSQLKRDYRSRCGTGKLNKIKTKQKEYKEYFLRRCYMRVIIVKPVQNICIKSDNKFRKLDFPL